MADREKFTGPNHAPPDVPVEKWPEMQLGGVLKALAGAPKEAWSQEDEDLLRRRAVEEIARSKAPGNWRGASSTAFLDIGGTYIRKSDIVAVAPLIGTPGCSVYVQGEKWFNGTRSVEEVVKELLEVTAP